MKKFKKPEGIRKDWIIALSLGALAALFFAVTRASYVASGVAADLEATWAGLKSQSVAAMPIMKAFNFGLLNLLSGIIATITLYHLVTFFVRERIGGEMVEKWAAQASRIAGVVAAIIFIFTPAVRYSATHLEPRLFHATWAMAIFALAIPFARSRTTHISLFAALTGVLVGLGLVDSILFGLLYPLYIAMIVVVGLKRGKKPYSQVFLFLFLSIFAFALTSAATTGIAGRFLTLKDEIKIYFGKDVPFLKVAVFSTLPFLASLFSSYNAYNEESKFSQWVFHGALTILSMLAIITTCAPSAMLRNCEIVNVPVTTSIFVAVVAGYIASYWYLIRVAPVRKNESHDAVSVATKGKHVAIVMGGFYISILSLAILIRVFSGIETLTVSADNKKVEATLGFGYGEGEFADLLADKILDDLGDRKWLVSDGRIDDNILLAAKRRGQELHLISLNRDLDTKYLEELAKLIKAENLGGSKCDDLVLSARLGVLSFLQDWFACDNTVGERVAIFGAPDLWYSAGFTPVPEFAFFGADDSRKVEVKAAWEKFSHILKAPRGWGSYNLQNVKNPMVQLRLSLRRHVGMVANNRGVYLLGRGDQAGAFEMFELVLNEIDKDNVCALFNEIELARAGYSKAVAKRQELEKIFEKIKADKNRRYHSIQLSNYYGYIHSPEIFIRNGCTWARFGRPGEALSHINRAYNLIPNDRRSSLWNMMAALYANEGKIELSRKHYTDVLRLDAANHEALLGMMRLELIDGNEVKALQYLERAAQAGEGTVAKVELAMVALMKNELDNAQKLLNEVTRENPQNMQAWSLLAAVMMQQCDAAKDQAKKDKLEKELENVILPQMEKQARGPFDYYVQSTKAFLLMRKGADKRREARDAFIAASRSRPDIAATQDIVLGLDISLADTVNAEIHAKEVLRKNRRAPLANYVMGSLALGRGEYDVAKTYLHHAADANRPVVLAMNDLAEAYRRTGDYVKAESYARLAVKTNPKLYVAWETLGSILMDAGKNMDEAEESVKKACELSKVDGQAEDVRMLMSLARIQDIRGDKAHARLNLRKVEERLKELSDFEKRSFEELKKRVR